MTLILEVELPAPLHQTEGDNLLKTVEKEIILRTLDLYKGNKTATARALRISRRSLHNKLAEYRCDYCF